jgi:hypothetical protein
MQEHRKPPTKQAQRWKTTGNAPTHVLEGIYVIARGAYLHLCLGDCEQILSVSLICRI